MWETSTTYIHVNFIESPSADLAMPVRQPAKIGEVAGSGGKLLHIPKAYIDGNNLHKGDVVELLFDDVLVLIPWPSPQADRVRRAMAEEG